MAWVLGGHNDATLRRLLDKVGISGKTFVTDDGEGCHRVILPDQLFMGKDLTPPIEQDNSSVRHTLARFRRKTKVVQVLNYGRPVLALAAPPTRPHVLRRLCQNLCIYLRLGRVLN